MLINLMIIQGYNSIEWGRTYNWSLKLLPLQQYSCAHVVLIWMHILWLQCPHLQFETFLLASYNQNQWRSQQEVASCSFPAIFSLVFFQQQGNLVLHSTHLPVPVPTHPHSVASPLSTHLLAHTCTHPHSVVPTHTPSCPCYLYLRRALCSSSLV